MSVGGPGGRLDRGGVPVCTFSSAVRLTSVRRSCPVSLALSPVCARRSQCRAAGLLGWRSPCPGSCFLLWDSGSGLLRRRSGAVSLTGSLSCRQWAKCRSGPMWVKICVEFQQGSSQVGRVLVESASKFGLSPRLCVDRFLPGVRSERAVNTLRLMPRPSLEDHTHVRACVYS